MEPNNCTWMQSQLLAGANMKLAFNWLIPTCNMNQTYTPSRILRCNINHRKRSPIGWVFQSSPPTTVALLIQIVSSRQTGTMKNGMLSKSLIHNSQFPIWQALPNLKPRWNRAPRLPIWLPFRIPTIPITTMSITQMTLILNSLHHHYRLLLSTPRRPRRRRMTLRRQDRNSVRSSFVTSEKCSGNDSKKSSNTRTTGSPARGELPFVSFSPSCTERSPRTCMLPMKTRSWNWSWQSPSSKSIKSNLTKIGFHYWEMHLISCIASTNLVLCWETQSFSTPSISTAPAHTACRQL